VPWWFVIPALIVFAAIVLIPNVQAVFYSFTNWDGLSASYNWVGISNYVAAFQDPHATIAIRNTILLTVVVTILQMAFGLLLALALNSRIRTSSVLRAIFFTPVILTPVALGYIWQYMLAPTGVVNQMLESVGLNGLVRDWLGDPSVNLWAIAAIVIWQSTGFTMAIYLAGLQAVPAELLEAASLDGAGRWQSFWHVTRPLLAPATLINSVLCVIGCLKLFDIVYVTTGGGPAHSTATLATLSYTDGFLTGDYSFGVTISVILSVVVTVAAAIQFRLLGRGNTE
jgi:raffinose/stachyose/melibiose transport system permease protein